MKIRTYMTYAVLIGSTFLLNACGGGGGSGNSNSPVSGTPSGPVSTDTPYNDPVSYSGAASASLPSATESAAVTHHQITLNGKVINYTATIGHLTATNPSTGAPEASFFYIAYTADNQPAATRPVTFFLSGGPGSSQVGLHLGAFAPRRAVTNYPSLNEPSQTQLTDNQDSLIDTTDMVFLDEVGAGYSEAIAPNTNSTFWGIDVDAAVYRDFVLRYLNANQRTASPTFLYGHSYGTARGAIMSNLLASSGVKLAGLILNSSILNAATDCDSSLSIAGTGNCAGDLPTYAATAAYYNLITPAPTDITTLMTQARALDSNDYMPALASFMSTQQAPSADLTTQLAAYTGVSASLWQSQFALNENVYRASLLPNLVIGRADSRIAVPSSSPYAAPENDPTDAALTFGSAWLPYLNTELKFTNGSTYISQIPLTYSTWPHVHNGSSLPDFIPDLASAMTQNPTMKILSINGYYDLNTAFYQTEQDLARLGTNPNIQITHYAAGHETFLDNNARPLMKADLAAFYQGAISAH